MPCQGTSTGIPNETPCEFPGRNELAHLPTSTVDAEHYVWGSVCDGWRLLNEADLSVIQERVPPGQGEVRHFHRTDTESKGSTAAGPG
jgi:hypothetical protein